MSTDTNTANGSAAAIPLQSTKTAKTAKPAAPAEPYRPTASTDKVRQEVEQSMGRIVLEALYQGTHFIQLANHYDRDAADATRYGHLVDATECMEIALTHLAMFKAALNYRAATEIGLTEARYWPTDQY